VFPPNPPVAGTGATGAAGSGTITPTPPVTGSGEPRIPAKVGECPKLATGNITVLGQQVQLWVGKKQEGVKGPVMFYWHGTGSSASEAVGGLGGALNEIQQQGGLVASFTTTTKKGQNTGNNVWYTGDFEMSDQILACAVEQLNIDTQRIYTAGCSAGGLQAGSMVYGRSSYLAAAMPNSGGTTFPFKLEDPAHVPALITTHGAMGKDVVVIEFTTTSQTETKDIAAKGGFAVDCDHGGGHCGSPAAVKAAQWQFLKDHPFGVKPEPYAAGLPASFPTFCKIIK
jgi:poly(3-hydroxybutyrate) depolymerase